VSFPPRWSNSTSQSHLPRR